METSSREGGQGLSTPSVLHPALQVMEVLPQGAAEKHHPHHAGELTTALITPLGGFEFCPFEPVPEVGGAELHPNLGHMRQKSGSRMEGVLHGREITLLRSPSAIVWVHPTGSILTVQKGSPSYAWRVVSSPAR